MAAVSVPAGIAAPCHTSIAVRVPQPLRSPSYTAAAGMALFPIPLVAVCVGPTLALPSGMTTFRDRRHAGQVLARHVRKYAHLPGTCVVGLPRGGVPVAYEVARALNAPLDVFIVRKLGVPGHEELALGAIAAGPSTLAKQLINWDTVRAWGVTNTSLNAIIGREQRELLRREELYRGSNRGLSLTGKNVVLVDDGLATGSTMRVAVMALREYHPTRIIVAVPIGDPKTCREMAQLADESICAVTPNPLHSVGRWYDDFEQTSDTEVQYLLVQAARENASAGESRFEAVRAG